MSRRTASRGIVIVLTEAITLLSSGCGTTAGMIGASWMKLSTLTNTKDKVYIGTRLDYAVMTEPRSNGGGGGSLSGAVGLVDLAARVIWVPDLILSAVCDSLLLPLTLRGGSATAKTLEESESPND